MGDGEADQELTAVAAEGWMPASMPGCVSCRLVPVCACMCVCVCVSVCLSLCLVLGVGVWGGDDVNISISHNFTCFLVPSGMNPSCPHDNGLIKVHLMSLFTYLAFLFLFVPQLGFPVITSQRDNLTPSL